MGPSSKLRTGEGKEHAFCYKAELASSTILFTFYFDEDTVESVGNFNNEHFESKSHDENLVSV